MPYSITSIVWLFYLYIMSSVKICHCEQCKGVKSKRHKARRKIKRMLSKKRRTLKEGEVFNFYYA